jgi:hypothetical protein
VVAPENQHSRLLVSFGLKIPPAAVITVSEAIRRRDKRTFAADLCSTVKARIVIEAAGHARDVKGVKQKYGILINGKKKQIFHSNQG